MSEYLLDIGGGIKEISYSTLQEVPNLPSIYLPYIYIVYCP